MKTILYPENGWQVSMADRADGTFLDARALSRGETVGDVTWYPTAIPTSVQDVLCENGVLPASARQGQADYAWVAERDWIYLAHFPLPALPADAYAEFHFLGLDTVATIYCNGEEIGAHEDMFLRKIIPVSCLREGDNILTIHFRSPIRAAAELAQEMPEDWKLVMTESRLLRKVPSDYSTFLGCQVVCTCVGLFDEVSLHVYPTHDRLTVLQADTDVSQDLGRAIFEGVIEAEGAAASAVRVSVTGPDGSACSSRYPLRDGQAVYQMELSDPLLWWPAGYGPQNLYTVKAELLDGDTVLDVLEKRVGVRLVEYAGDFRFTINGKRIRLWGSNFVNVEGITHWCDPARVRRLLELARDGNLNTMRIWGEGPLLPDLFYDLADELGILVWQDFGLGFGPWPDDGHHRALFRQEVEQMVLRLRHHASLLIWCGSNETYMTGISENMDGLPRYGFDLIFRDAKKLCERLDPRRLYLPTSPMGGDYPQDASGGDIHGYWGVDFEPGLQYPVLFSESCHATAYSKHSMLRFMTEEEIWPEGYQDVHLHDPAFFDAAAKKAPAVPGNYGISFQNYWRQISVPDTWRPHLSCFAPSEFWDFEQYFSAHDVDSILYKYAVCGADFYKREIERIRRGRPCSTPFAPRRCNGYLTWKYNDAWPHINFTQIDYYLEPTAQYYAIRRACASVVAGVSAEQDHLYLWAVNDSGEEVRGEIVLRLFSRLRNQVEREYTFPVWLRPDESRVVDCLDWVGSLHREQILHTTFTASDGTLIGTNVCYLDMERNLAFPAPHITLSWENGLLAVRTDQYARYVELLGESADGDAFGWDFSDNYFDLLPFETKYIRVKVPCDTGTIRAIPHYGTPSAPISL